MLSAANSKPGPAPGATERWPGTSDPHTATRAQTFPSHFHQIIQPGLRESLPCGEGRCLLHQDPHPHLDHTCGHVWVGGGRHTMRRKLELGVQVLILVCVAAGRWLSVGLSGGPGDREEGLSRSADLWATLLVMCLVSKGKCLRLEHVPTRGRGESHGRLDKRHGRKGLGSHWPGSWSRCGDRQGGWAQSVRSESCWRPQEACSAEEASTTNHAEAVFANVGTGCTCMKWPQKQGQRLCVGPAA